MFKERRPIRIQKLEGGGEIHWHESPLPKTAEAEAFTADTVTSAEASKVEGSFEDEQSQEMEKAISEASDFSALFAALQQELYIKNEEGKEYNTTQMSEMINMVRQGRERANAVTRAFGLRDKVMDLYGREEADLVKTPEQAEVFVKRLALVNVEPLTGTSGEAYESIDELSNRIQLVITGDLDPNYVTSKYGLRSMALRLRGES